MLHNLRRRPLPDYLKTKLQRLRKRRRVTLCIAATGYVGEVSDHQLRIVYGWDAREENQFTGGDVAFKVEIVKSMIALQSGEESAPEDFLSTCRICLPDNLHFSNAFDQLNAAVGTHKQKLCQRKAQKKFGIDYDRVLTKGEQELPAETRERFFYDLEKLDPGYEVIIFGFDGVGPLIFVVDGYDVRSCSQGFATVGSGAVIAETVLYQRKQQFGIHLDYTVYNVYEAFRLASGAAPGVGSFTLAIASPSTDPKNPIESKFVNDAGKEMLEEAFQKFGPRAVEDPPMLATDHFQ
jgi:hypothetical protein